MKALGGRHDWLVQTYTVGSCSCEMLVVMKRQRANQVDTLGQDSRVMQGKNVVRSGRSAKVSKEIWLPTMRLGSLVTSKMPN